MVYLAIQPHVGFALVEERPIFLDVRRDRYFGLDRDSEQGFLAAHRSSGALDLEDELASRLLATGLFASGVRPRPLEPAQFQPPERGLSGGPSRLRPAEIATAWLLIARARRQLRRQKLERLIDRRRTQRRPSRYRTPDEIEALCARFRRARALVPIEPTCLQDSLALRDWLHARQASAPIVFGVKLDPFAAHCWVQSGNTVLNDAPDKVREFTPILVVP
jgi:hypothetical protein